MHDDGMTILEVLIATMILGVVAIVIFASFGIGLRAAALAGSMSTATALAEEDLARLAASRCGASLGSGAGAVAGADRGRFHREATARPVDADGLWELTATVSWTQERRERTVTLATLWHRSAACEIVEGR